MVVEILEYTNRIEPAFLWLNPVSAGDPEVSWQSRTGIADKMDILEIARNGCLNGCFFIYRIPQGKPRFWSAICFHYPAVKNNTIEPVAICIFFINSMWTKLAESTVPQTGIKLQLVTYLPIILDIDPCFQRILFIYVIRLKNSFAL